jgi:hypothetical protein
MDLKPFFRYPPCIPILLVLALIGILIYPKTKIS